LKPSHARDVYIAIMLRRKSSLMMRFFVLHDSSEWSGQCDQCKYLQTTWLVSIHSLDGQ
jgi:hypothetical protein